MPNESTPERFDAATSAALEAAGIPSSDLALRVDELGAGMRSRTDNWESLITGIGDMNRDKRLSMSFKPDRPITPVELNRLYKGSGLAGSVVDRVPDDYLRRGIVLKHNDEDASKTDKLSKRLSELRVLERIGQAMKWARLHAGATVVMAIDDGGTLVDPVNEANINRIKWMRAFTRHELTVQWDDWDRDFESEQFGEPKFYTFQTTSLTVAGASPVNTPGKKIHASRVLRFDGFDLPNMERISRMGWGGSTLERAYDALRDFAAVTGALAVLGVDFSQPVMEIDGLRQMLASNEEGLILKRIALLDMARSVLRVMLVDKGEKFSREIASIAGADVLLDSALKRVAAEIPDVPLSLIINERGGGLGESRAAEVRMYYDKIEAKQENGPERACIERALKLVQLEKGGATGGVELKDMKLTFPSQWRPTKEEELKQQKTQAEIDWGNIEHEIVKPWEVAVSRYSTATYSYETTIDVEAHKREKAELEQDPPPAPGDGDPAPPPADPAGAPPKGGKAPPPPAPGKPGKAGKGPRT